MKSEDIREWIESSGRYQFSRSGGPGGQNVNTRSTKVTLILPVSDLPLEAPLMQLLLRRLAGRITADGELHIVSSEHRTQLANRRAAEDRGLELILAALKRDKKRRRTRPTKASKERRLNDKKLRSRVKEWRKRP